MQRCRYASVLVLALLSSTMGIRAGALPPPDVPVQTPQDRGNYAPMQPSAAPAYPSAPTEYSRAPVSPLPTDPLALTREQEHQKAEAARGERRRRAEEAFAFQHKPRVWLFAGMAPTMLSRPLRDGGVKRFRERAFTLTVAYRQKFLPSVGLQAAFEAGVGATHVSYKSMPFSECCASISKSTGTGYSLGFEVAPWLNPVGGLYFAPGVVVRTLWGKTARVQLVDESPLGDADPKEHAVRFQRPLVAVNARLGMGFVFGARRRFDGGWGVDAGRAVGSARRSLGVFVRIGGAFGGAGTPR